MQIGRNELELAATRAGQRQRAAQHRLNKGVGEAVLPIGQGDDRVALAERAQIAGSIAAEVADLVRGEQAAMASLQGVVGRGRCSAEEGVATEQP